MIINAVENLHSIAINVTTLRRYVISIMASLM